MADMRVAVEARQTTRLAAYSNLPPSSPSLPRARRSFGRLPRPQLLRRILFFANGKQLEQ
eukprot:6547120-Pyramimonas_sp.AAC.2